MYFTAILFFFTFKRDVRVRTGKDETIKKIYFFSFLFLDFKFPYNFKSSPTFIVASHYSVEKYTISRAQIWKITLRRYQKSLLNFL